MEAETNIHRGTLVDIVYEKITGDIRTRHFSPGQKLVIRELSERYGISQTPIRQALNRLIADKVVENVPRCGINVRRIDWEEIDHTLRARLMVEEHCLSGIMERTGDAAFMGEMESIASAHRELCSRTDYPSIFTRHIKLDMQFHQTLVGCCRNDSIRRYYQELTSPIYLNYVYFEKTLQRILDSCDEHQAIFRALAAGDGDAVRAALAIHNANTREDYKKIMQSRPDL